MMKQRRFTSLKTAAVAAALTGMAAIAFAQPIGPGPGGPGGPGPGGPGPRGPGWNMPGPGMMMGPGAFGPGMMGPRGYGMMCGPQAAGFAEWRIDRLERAIRPTDAQRAKLDELKATATKAADTMRTACPTEIPTTMVGRMEQMEKRMEVMLGAIKTMRPALDAFYATLTAEQKARLDGNTGPGRFWRWRDRS